MTLIHPFTCPPVYPPIHPPTHIPSRYSTNAIGTPTMCIVESKELKVPSCDLRRLKSPGEEKTVIPSRENEEGNKGSLSLVSESHTWGVVGSFWVSTSPDSIPPYPSSITVPRLCFLLSVHLHLPPVPGPHHPHWGPLTSPHSCLCPPRSMYLNIFSPPRGCPTSITNSPKSGRKSLIFQTPSRTAPCHPTPISGNRNRSPLLPSCLQPLRLADSSSEPPLPSSPSLLSITPGQCSCLGNTVFPLSWVFPRQTHLPPSIDLLFPIPPVCSLLKSTKELGLGKH